MTQIHGNPTRESKGWIRIRFEFERASPKGYTDQVGLWEGAVGVKKHHVQE